MGWLGGGNDAAEDQLDHQNEQIKKKFEYDKAKYEYQWGISKDDQKNSTN